MRQSHKDTVSSRLLLLCNDELDERFAEPWSILTVLLSQVCGKGFDVVVCLVVDELGLKFPQNDLHFWLTLRSAVGLVGFVVSPCHLLNIVESRLFSSDSAGISLGAMLLVSALGSDTISWNSLQIDGALS